ncbi:MAG TPA: Hsp20 family protein [Ferrovibrio sp.]|jgi:molecular chaperone IbpA|uniref:Hsp20 family protein n=1 Tax=Ferrovibrio sp. TaxID=1917215 RepID=UPI002B4B43C2|nr:Hsp20 family protein [Ferrovibrio sp.]HLT79013.1 Hsp20 family protein [Ferrovibrio sp.]
MRAFDFSPLLRSSIGFDHVNRLFDLANRIDDAAASYPPYNIEKRGEDTYRITMAVAGFRPDELDVTVKENSLIISGKAAEQPKPEEQVTVLHRGIARRAFERRFELADTVKVTGAELKDGLLHIALKREVPEAKKPRQIPITTAANAGTVIEAQPKAA